jgi:hypothetical protein
VKETYHELVLEIIPFENVDVIEESNPLIEDGDED